MHSLDVVTLADSSDGVAEIVEYGHIIALNLAGWAHTGRYACVINMLENFVAAKCALICTLEKLDFRSQVCGNI